jgi:hypothetical protein
MTVGNDKQQEHAAVDDGSNEEGEGGKSYGDGNERARATKRRMVSRQGWHGTKRAMAMAARAMATRVMGKKAQPTNAKRRGNVLLRKWQVLARCPD